MEWVAGELGMSAGDLEDLVARGLDAAAHLYQCLHALGLSTTDAEHAAQGHATRVKKAMAKSP
jgi:hypothetical protein